jgi:uncharacterized protein (TIGR02284 family)
MNATHEYIDILQDLIASNRDAQQGYQDAAVHVNNPELKAFFNQQSIERAQFAGVLEQEVQHLGESDPKRSGTVAGALHRAWFDLKTKFSSDDHSVLESVEAGEDRARSAYEKAATADLPENLRKIVQGQYQHVLEGHDRVRSLRDGLKAA